MKTLIRSLFAIVALVFVASLAAPVLHAQDLGAIKSNMTKRLPQIDKFKEAGVLGENNRGYLEVRVTNGEASQIAADENADRNAVYSAIAAKQNTSAEDVGKARARQIAQNSSPGIWIQDAQGNWAKK